MGYTRDNKVSAKWLCEYMLTIANTKPTVYGQLDDAWEIYGGWLPSYQAFGFDCINFIKSVRDGWCGSKELTHGGAIYDASRDHNEWGIIQYECNNKYTEIAKMSSIEPMLPGSYLVTGNLGHGGIYVGKGKVVECTTSWGGGVKISDITLTGGVGKCGLRSKDGQSGRAWAYYAQLDWVDYSKVTSKTVMTGWNGQGYAGPIGSGDGDSGYSGPGVNEFIAALKDIAEKDSSYLGCSYYVRSGLIQAGIATDAECNEGTLWALGSKSSYFDSRPSMWKKITGSESELTSQLQDGDIMWYNGQHVAVYFQNGILESIPASSLDGTYHIKETGYQPQFHTCGNLTCLYRLAGSSYTSSDLTRGDLIGSKGYEIDRVSLGKAAQGPVYEAGINYVSYTKTVHGEFIETAEGNYGDTSKLTNLLSTPTLVESPFIILKVGDYTFGSYTKASSGERNKWTVDFPNYMTRLSVVKVNGAVNQYTISLVYQIEAGDNPNMIDQIFSTVSYNNIYISYGDWNAPNFTYKEDECLLTKVTHDIDFANSRITYTINATSNATSLAATSYYFGPKTAKPSDIIMQMLYSENDRYGLLKVFPGMRNKTKVLQEGWIITDDQAVEIDAQKAMDPISYLNYLVSYMTASSNKNNSILKDSSYYLTVHDDGGMEYGGSYFKITKVTSNSTTLSSYNTYEIDIGFPDIRNSNSNFVIDFKINTDNSWAMLYDYSEKVKTNQYTHYIGNDGKLYTESSPSIVTSSKTFKPTTKQKQWWTQMTQFPVNATLVIKGLLKPSMLMTYLKCNCYFHGEKHSSSGLYIITRQVDEVTSSGFRTTLQLTRIAGDNDYITSSTRTITKNVPIVTLKQRDATEYQKARSVDVVVKSRNIVSSDNTPFAVNTDKVETAKAETTRYLTNKLIADGQTVSSSSGGGGGNISGTINEANANAKLESIGNITYADVKKAADERGLSDTALTYMLSWVLTETHIGSTDYNYYNYLCACAFYNLWDSYFKRDDQKMTNFIHGWGSFYSHSNTVKNANVVKEGSVKPLYYQLLYLALKNTDTRPLGANGLCKENGYPDYPSKDAAIYSIWMTDWGHPAPATGKNEGWCVIT